MSSDINDINNIYSGILMEGVLEKFSAKFPSLSRAILAGILASSSNIDAAEKQAQSLSSDKVAVARPNKFSTNDFKYRVEQLVSFLETGKKPRDIYAIHRGQTPASRSDRFGDAYYISLGNKNMGNAIHSKPYTELDKTFKGAKGKYQIIPLTFNDLVKNHNLYDAVPSAKRDFSPNTQDKIFEHMARVKYNYSKAIESYSRGKVDEAILFLSREWASIPKDSTDRSYYNDGRNKALASFKTVKDFLTGNIGIDQVKKLSH